MQAPLLFEDIGLGHNNYPKLLAACNGTEYFLASLVPIFVIERIGRRKLMLFGVRRFHSSFTLVVYLSYRRD